MIHAGAPTPAAGRGDQARTWVPTLLFIVLILVTAFRPVPALLRGRHLDKLLHFIAYGILSVLAYRSFERNGSRWPAALAFLLALLVGFADEGIQMLGTRRTADRFDLVADAAGAFTGSIVTHLAPRRTTRQRP